MTSDVRVRALLAPASHPPVDELGIQGQAVVGADAEALGHARAEALDQQVRALDQAPSGPEAVGVLEIDRDRTPTPQQKVPLVLFPDTRYPDHVGTEIGEDHARERSWTDPAQFYDSHVSERPL